MAMFKLLLSGLAATHVAAVAPADAYRVSVRAGFYTGVHDSIAITRVQDDETANSAWVVERRRRTTMGPDGPVQSLSHDWIDGRSCPELKPVILQIGPLARAKPRRTPPPFHGALVNVTTVRRDGGETRVRDYEGPVAMWWRNAEQTLKPCWRTEPVVLNGAPLPAKLDSDEAERRFTPATSDW